MILAHVKDIIGSEYGHNLETAWRYIHPFKFNIVINVPQLVDDFHEDLEFRFSLGITSLIKRIVSYTSGRPMTSMGRDPFAAMTV